MCTQKVDPRGCKLWGATDGGGNVEKKWNPGGAGGTGDPFRGNGHQKAAKRLPGTSTSGSVAIFLGF